MNIIKELEKRFEITSHYHLISSLILIINLIKIKLTLNSDIALGFLTVKVFLKLSK